jgi:LacI family transcriptional regulator
MAEDRAGSTRRVGRAGLQDVARLAGVGIATVDRVLNERGNVSPATARRVIEAARQLDLKRVLPRPYARLLRFEVLLARSDTLFLARLSQGFASVAATLSRSAIVQRTALREADPARIAERVRASKADGIILYAEEHPEIAAAIIALAGAGKPVVCLVTDMPGSRRIAYVGIDNGRAGRTAGFLAARMVRGSGAALILTNHLSFRAHAERVEGFRAGLAQEAPGMRVAAILQGHDEEDRAAQLVGAALREHPDITALYNSGGAVAAVAAMIRKRRAPGEIVYIGHELNAETTALLREGTLTLTIDQAFELQAWRAVEVLLHRFGQLDSFPGSVSVPFTLHTRENV